MVTLGKNTVAELWGLSPEEKRETAEWLRYEAREQERKAGKANGFDYSELLKRIMDRYGSISSFAVAMNRKKDTIKRILDNRRHFTQEDITRACECLGISGEDVHRYFFRLQGEEARNNG